MNRLFLVLMVLAVLASYTGPAYSQCALSGSGAAGKGEVCNTTCPVMKGEVAKDTPYKHEYNGKTIGFCCAGCVDKFKADPEKYVGNLGLGSDEKIES